MLEDVSRLRIPLPERGVELAVLDWGGDGPPILCHHANGFCAAMWDEVARGVCGRFRVLAVDARGHGDSSRPEGPQAYRWSEMALDLAAVGKLLLPRIGAERFALGVGHSFGGTLTLATAAFHPHLYARILLLDPVFILEEESASRQRAERRDMLLERSRRRRHHFGDRAEARRWFAERDLFASWTPRALDLYVGEGLRDAGDGVELKCPGEVEGAVFAGDPGMDLFERASRLEVSALLLRAAQGHFPRAIYDRIARAAGARVEELDAGHLIPMERPDLVVDALLRFHDEAGVRA